MISNRLTTDNCKSVYLLRQNFYHPFYDKITINTENHTNTVHDLTRRRRRTSKNEIKISTQASAFSSIECDSTFGTSTHGSSHITTFPTLFRIQSRSWCILRKFVSSSSSSSSLALSFDLSALMLLLKANTVLTTWRKIRRRQRQSIVSGSKQTHCWNNRILHFALSLLLFYLRANNVLVVESYATKSISPFVKRRGCTKRASLFQHHHSDPTRYLDMTDRVRPSSLENMMYIRKNYENTLPSLQHQHYYRKGWIPITTMYHHQLRSSSSSSSDRIITASSIDPSSSSSSSSVVVAVPVIVDGTNATYQYDAVTCLETQQRSSSFLSKQSTTGTDESSKTKQQSEPNGSTSITTSTTISSIVVQSNVESYITVSSSTSSLSASSLLSLSSSMAGLSKFHLSLLRRTKDRQRFVTGMYPVIVSVMTNPTRKWLNRNRRTSSSSTTNQNNEKGETEIFINGTVPDRSLASLDRYHWMDPIEYEQFQNQYAMLAMELVAEISMERPGYVHILPSLTKTSSDSSLGEWMETYQSKDATSNVFMDLYSKWSASTQGPTFVNPDRKTNTNLQQQLDRIFQKQQQQQRLEKQQILHERLWVTGFTLTGRKGYVSWMDIDTCKIQSISSRSSSTLLWPNEVQRVPSQLILNRSSQSSLTRQPKQDLVVLNNLNTRIYQHSSNDSAIKPIDRNDVDAQTSTQQLNTILKSYNPDEVLVCDGFLVPTKDRGGIYVVRNPGHPTLETTIRLTSETERWFYHRAIWVDLTGDGRQSIVTCRCKVSTLWNSRNRNKNNSRDTKSKMSNGPYTEGMITSGIRKYGQLVWLECPKPSSYDPVTGIPLEDDGTVFDPYAPRHLPWKTHILTTGPDVMFAVADLDRTDTTIEIIASEFFSKKVSLHSIQTNTSQPRVVFSRTIDATCGLAFGCILANLEPSGASTHNQPPQRVLDSGSTIPTLQSGDTFSHILVTSHECTYKDENIASTESSDDSSCTKINGSASKVSSLIPTGSTPAVEEGGSLFAYRVPDRTKDAWKNDPWIRSTIASGFKVNGQLTNMINPGAPGFVYTFYSKLPHPVDRRPMIAVAGDCAESAYIYRPSNENEIDTTKCVDPATQYKLMVEIECGATVGSIGVGYDDIGTSSTSSSESIDSYAKLYIPCYEKDKVLVFGFGSDDEFDDGW